MQSICAILFMFVLQRNNMIFIIVLMAADMVY